MHTCPFDGGLNITQQFEPNSRGYGIENFGPDLAAQVILNDFQGDKASSQSFDYFVKTLESSTEKN